MKSKVLDSISRNNNFDIIRLFAALQVVILHTINHLNLQNYYSDFLSIISLFPGVLIFFVISGFLITRSFCGCMSKSQYNILRQYFKNRFLRIFPGLWISFVLLLVILFFFKIIDSTDLLRKDIIFWIIGQISIFQYYTPDILRDFGVGTPNGSLWTIPVEIEFYIVLPFIFLIKRKCSLNMKLIVLFLLSLLFNIVWTAYGTDSIVNKLIGVSVVPYLYSFLLGSLIYLNWNRIKFLFENRFGVWLLMYIVYCTSFNVFPSYQLFGGLNIISNLLLGGVTISAAFSYKKLGNLLQGNDISYGIYIYHMLVINIFVELELTENFWDLIWVLIITIIISIISWNFVEKKVLSLKYRK